jgi:hypothetical protein
MKEDKFVWFTAGAGVVGIGRMVDDITGEVKYYISVVDGYNKQADEYRVLNWGATFPAAAGFALFGE